MGLTTSRPRSVSISPRAPQLTRRKRRSSSQSTCPSTSAMSTDSLGCSFPSTANSSRLPSIEYGESQSMLINQQLQKQLFPTQSEHLTLNELNLVHTTWQNVISDSSNICLNFFQQIKKTKKIQKGKKAQRENSTGLASSNTGNPMSANFLQNGSKHNDQIYYALRLSCCIDRLIFNMRVEDSNPMITNRRTNPEYSLDDNGELLEFLNLESLSLSELDRLIGMFVETLKLITIHSKSSSSIQWTEDIHNAWVKFLQILINELKDQ